MRYTVHPKKLPRTLPQATNKSKASKEHRHQKDTTPAKVVKCFFGDRTKEEAKSRSVSVGRKEKKNATISKNRSECRRFSGPKKKKAGVHYSSPLYKWRQDGEHFHSNRGCKERKKKRLVSIIASLIRLTHTHTDIYIRTPIGYLLRQEAGFSKSNGVSLLL